MTEKIVVPMKQQSCDCERDQVSSAYCAGGRAGLSAWQAPFNTGQGMMAERSCWCYCYLCLDVLQLTGAHILGELSLQLEAFLNKNFL